MKTEKLTFKKIKEIIGFNEGVKEIKTSVSSGNKIVKFYTDEKSLGAVYAAIYKKAISSEYLFSIRKDTKVRSCYHKFGTACVVLITDGSIVE